MQAPSNGTWTRGPEGTLYFITAHGEPESTIEASEPPSLQLDSLEADPGLLRVCEVDSHFIRVQGGLRMRTSIRAGVFNRGGGVYG
jgi:hypothetical protein